MFEWSIFLKIQQIQMSSFYLFITIDEKLTNLNMKTCQFEVAHKKKVYHETHKKLRFLHSLFARTLIVLLLCRMGIC